MAHILEAYNLYGPRIRRGVTADLDEVARFVAQSTGLDDSQIRMVLGKLRDAVLHYTQQGRGITLEGIIHLWPTIDRHGEVSLGRRLNHRLLKALNRLERFKAHIDNFEHREWKPDDYHTAWDEDHPLDPIEY